MVPGGQSDIGADTSRLLEPDRIVDCRLEAECGDRADARRGHEPANLSALPGYARRNLLVPILVFESFEALNSYLLECCRRRMADCLRGRDGMIGERLERDLAAFQTPLPAPYDACEKVATTVSSLSLVCYRLNDYSVPTIYGHRDVLVRG
jgi:hypothetical protein